MSSLEKQHHLIEIQRSNPPSDPKQFKKWMSLQRRQLKIAKEERWLSLGREIALELPKALISETGNIGRGVADAHGEMLRGWLGNSDPLTWTAGAGFVFVYVTMVITVLQKLGEKLGIKHLAADLGVDYLLNMPQTVTSTVSLAVGRDDVNGLFGVEVIDASGNPVITPGIRWYTSTTSRDAAFILLQVPGLGIAYGDFSNGGTGYRKVSRVFTQGGGFVTYQSATPPPGAGTLAQPLSNVPSGFYYLIETFPDGSIANVPISTSPGDAQASLVFALKSVPSIYMSVTLAGPKP